MLVTWCALVNIIATLSLLPGGARPHRAGRKARHISALLQLGRVGQRGGVSFLATRRQSEAGCALITFALGDTGAGDDQEGCQDGAEKEKGSLEISRFHNDKFFGPGLDGEPN